MLSLMNLMSGCVAIIMILQGQMLLAVYLMGFALVFDFLDGLAARLLRAYSSIGKELDSLSDMISFGIFPAIILFMLIENATEKGNAFASLFPYISLLIPVCSAIRLARFSSDNDQEASFRGLPVPAMAIFIASLPLVLHFQPDIKVTQSVTSSPLFLSVVSVILSLLMVSPFRMFSIKFKNFSWHGNELRYIFLAVSAMLILTLHCISFPVIILIYIVVSVALTYISPELI